MSERNSMLCKLCQKVLAQDAVSNHHCEAWCEDEEDNQKLQAKNLKK